MRDAFRRRIARKQALIRIDKRRMLLTNKRHREILEFNIARLESEIVELTVKLLEIQNDYR